MIEFHLDGSSGIAAYMQIVQQVKQALRARITARDNCQRARSGCVAGDQSNTVLKAYRQLEMEGLVAGRQGQGTFVLKSLAGPELAGHAALRDELVKWLERAWMSGLDGESIAAAVRRPCESRLSPARQGGRSSMTNVLTTIDLGKRYRGGWALRHCSLELPAGRIAALIGPNGAGKSTLLNLAVGLLQPTEGEVRVLGASPRDDPAALARIGFIAQDRPLYRGFTVAEMLRFGASLNPRWDGDMARSRLDRLGIPLDRKIEKLSGGQQAQVALVLALAKRAELILLDEPVAALDPLARRELLQTLMETAVDHGLTVMLSSHLVGELERVCDYLILLKDATVQYAGIWTTSRGHIDCSSGSGSSRGAGADAPRHPRHAHRAPELDSHQFE